MKKILYMLLCLFLLVGCTHQTGDNTETLFSKYHDQIMNGDFSAIAGEYVNPEGHTIYIDSNEGENAKNIRYFNGTYVMDKYDKEGYGYLMRIYDIGTEVTCYYNEDKTLIIDTDTSKIRVFTGNADPISNSSIYTKKEE